MTWGGGGGGGYLTKFNTGRLRPELQPLTLFIYHFGRKGTPFIYLLLKNGTPFTYLLEEVLFSFSCGA